MGLLRRKGPLHSIPVHADDLASKDWTIVTEAGTIVGPSPNKARMGATHFLMKTLPRVASEMALHVLALAEPTTLHAPTADTNLDIAPNRDVGLVLSRILRLSA